MALTDLLWACPECHEDRGLELRGSEAVCRRCGARYRRGRGASIVGRPPDGTEVVRSPAEWLERLPGAAVVLEQRERELRNARVIRRSVVAMEPVRIGGRFLNRVERFGDQEEGELRLLADRLTFHAVPAGASPEQWPFDTLTAVQTSSKTLQLKARGRPLVAFRFTDDSIYLWEQLVNEAVRRFYHDTGLGEIVEFQPRITTA